LTSADHYYFCGSPSCPVVYFSEAAAFLRDAVLVPVFQKGAEGLRMVCYCLEIGEDQVRGEVEATGASASADRIKRLVQSERCGCALRNPQGTCCLGNVAALVTSMQRLHVS
jgi:hypothetical protein